MNGLIHFTDEHPRAKTLEVVLFNKVFGKAPNKDVVVLQNLLSGKTKEGIFGDEFFVINEKIVDLSEPLISDEGKYITGQSLSQDGGITM